MLACTVFVISLFILLMMLMIFSSYFANFLCMKHLELKGLVVLKEALGSSRRLTYNLGRIYTHTNTHTHTHTHTHTTAAI